MNTGMKIKTTCLTLALLLGSFAHVNAVVADAVVAGAVVVESNNDGNGEDEQAPAQTLAQKIAKAGNKTAALALLKNVDLSTYSDAEVSAITEALATVFVNDAGSEASPVVVANAVKLATKTVVAKGGSSVAATAAAPVVAVKFNLPSAGVEAVIVAAQAGSDEGLTPEPQEPVEVVKGSDARDKE